MNQSAGNTFSNNSPMLEVRGLSVSYGEKQALKALDFSIQEGEWWILAGPNGSGKTTLVNAVTRGVPSTGTIRWRGKNLRNMNSREMAGHIGVLAQNRSVDVSFSVGEVVQMGCYAHSTGWFGKLFRNDRGNKESSRQGRSIPASCFSEERAIEDALKAVGLSEMADRSILELSGGELQRVFLAQVFAQDPELLILDEPANHLDLVYQKQIFELLAEWIRTPGRAILTVVHDLSLALAFGQKGILMSEGKAAASGDVREVLSRDHLQAVYGMDVHSWMRKMLGQWDE